MYYVGDDEGMIISSSGISNTLIASSAPDIPVITNKSPFEKRILYLDCKKIL